MNYSRPKEIGLLTKWEMRRRFTSVDVMGNGVDDGLRKAPSQRQFLLSKCQMSRAVGGRKSLGVMRK